MTQHMTMLSYTFSFFLFIYVCVTTFKSEIKIKSDDFSSDFAPLLGMLVYRRTNKMWCNICLTFAKLHCEIVWIFIMLYKKKC